ncbi:hypothetical protein MEN41_07990 [Dolichospermum sp. ST_con]|nr:hypothetical protein [Dolichospermum sp. ST_con]MDD1421641.1 hypothetical protein [Dolichospermum sp. ST_sed1]MDD1423207.1 hypothetical protein [Dolichospermum sp. ST_sed9]MDD1433610.1 hypothetical protein [Dolichospermum sp. ST_sed6]MDD1441985.1 hypothetical protein [Dolichospermum sp. ST_sed3]MDD1449375.1 hypothetical protein [Dolichospermum sp. ST_sed8]MDD1457140.1 hypothetical protein [Dolichospermum sp. ST_sed7]MDD1461025.1 hypothetical protein [Dolichospermum sp. ST_sed2]MDD1463781
MIRTAQLSDSVSADLSVRGLHLTPKGDSYGARRYRNLSIEPTSDRNLSI